MLATIFDLLSTAVGMVIAVAMVVGLLLGVIGPAWEGTKADRYNFFIVFLPCLAFLLFAALFVGKVFGG